MNDLLGGQIDMMVEIMPTALPQMETGRLRALGVTSHKRMPNLPNLPTVAEQGVAGYEMSTWHGIVAPVRTPAIIIQRLNTWITDALRQPALRDRFAAQGLETRALTPTQFGDFIRSEIERWTKVVKASGARID